MTLWCVQVFKFLGLQEPTDPKAIKAVSGLFISFAVALCLSVWTDAASSMRL
jgi:hypothetical protein